MGSGKRFPVPAKVPLAAVAALLAVVPVAAQLTNASTSSLGLAGNDTAIVRGFAAISVNPAGLAMPDSEFSLAIVPVRIGGGVGPITLADVKPFEGKLVPAETKESWLEKVDSAEGQRGVAAIEVSEFAVTFWNVGFQLSSLVTANVRLPPSVVEAALFGNAGRTGAATDVSLADAWVEGYATTTAGLSLALPIPLLEERLGLLAAGATVKYTVGHALAVGRSAGTISAATLQADLDSFLIHTRGLIDGANLADDLLNGGGGLGVDLGLMLVLGSVDGGRRGAGPVQHVRLGRVAADLPPGRGLVRGRLLQLRGRGAAVCGRSRKRAGADRGPDLQARRAGRRSVPSPGRADGFQ